METTDTTQNPTQHTSQERDRKPARLPCEDHMMRLARRFMEQGFYQAASGVLAELSSTAASYQLRRIARVLSAAAAGYARWFLVQHEKAGELLDQAIEHAQGCDALSPWMDLLEQQAAGIEQIVRAFADDERAHFETYHNLVDTYYNSVCQALTGDYCTCLARFWRLYEGLLHHRLRTAHGVEPILTSPHPGPSEENELKLSEYLARLGRSRGRGTLYVHELREILRTVYGDSLFDDMGKTIVHADRGHALQPVELDRALTRIRQLRHDSAAAHGMRPVARSTANTCLIAGRALLDGYFSDRTDDIASHPFAPDRIAALASSVLSTDSTPDK